MEAHAQEHNVRLIAVAVSEMTSLAGEPSGELFRSDFPVHPRDGQRWYNSVGWFIANSALENDDAGYQSRHAAEKAAIKLGSYPLAPFMSTLGGMSQAPGMYP